MKTEPQVHITNEQQNKYTLEIRKPSTKYGDEFVKSRCAPDLAALKVFPNFKEITESFAAFRGIWEALKTFKIDLSLVANSNVHLVAVGDGMSPRTGATFAFRTHWQCHSVDPKMRPKWSEKGIKRLTVHSRTIQEALLPPAEFSVVVAVHSHADLQVALQNIHNPKIVLAIPCCTPQILHKPPDIQYDDYGIWSPKRTVKIWDLR